MNDIQVCTRTSALDLFATNLSDLISLPDPEAAEAMNQRMATWVRVEEMRERSYVERGIIARQFELRGLWRNLDDPETGRPFTSFTAWMNCRDYLGCRRTNFDAKADVKLLEGDIPLRDLAQITDKGNLQTMIGMSTAVRKDPSMLAAAKTMKNDAFIDKINREHPDQHYEKREVFRFSPGRSGAKIIEEAIAWAIEHEIAKNRDEALERMAEEALESWRLEQELDGMPEQEVEA